MHASNQFTSKLSSWQLFVCRCWGFQVVFPMYCSIYCEFQDISAQAADGLPYELRWLLISHYFWELRTILTTGDFLINFFHFASGSNISSSSGLRPELFFTRLFVSFFLFIWFFDIYWSDDSSPVLNVSCFLTNFLRLLGVSNCCWYNISSRCF